MPIRRAPFGAALAAALALSAGAARADIADMSDTEREAFREEVRAYLLEHPDVLMEAIAVLEQRQAEAQAQGDALLVRQNAEAIFEDEGSFVTGNPDGDITIVEFMDYNCGYCKRAFPEVEALLEQDGNIRFIVKEFPILSESSVLAARFALATREVAGDAAYEAVHDALMEGRGAISQASLDRLARDLDLDAKAIRGEMQSDTVNAILARNQRLAQALQVTGTPTFVMQDMLVRGFLPLDGMREIVASLRAE